MMLCMKTSKRHKAKRHKARHCAWKNLGLLPLKPTRQDSIRLKPLPEPFTALFFVSSCFNCFHSFHLEFFGAMLPKLPMTGRICR